MIVIVEGIDRVGKTTFCEKLKKLGFIYLKDEWNLNEEIKVSEVPIYSIGKLDTTISLLRHLHNQGHNIVVDRLHITELVYGIQSRYGNVNEELVSKIDCILAEMKCCLVYVYPEDVQKSSAEAGIDLSSHEQLFRALITTSLISEKYYTKYSELDNTIRRLMASIFKFDLYLASPFFNEVQAEREESIKSILREKGFKVFSPKESCFLPPFATLPARKNTFIENCEAIQSSIAVFAITDSKDMGTVWEAGYAFGIGKPVLYFAETLGGNQFNLMLAQSGRKVFLNRDEVDRTSILKAIYLESDEFKGLIE